jgi:hypothetical protein
MRRVLVVLLGLGMAMLSFDALRAYALTGHPLASGVIPTETILPRPWLAMLWAVVVDLAVAAGILGVKDDRGDWRAWLMLLLALAATLGFQVFALSPFVARAVPPVGLALAILVLDLGPARPKPATEARTPAPARLHAWLGSWDQAQPLPVPVAQHGPPAGSPGHDPMVAPVDTPVDQPQAAPSPTPLRAGARRPVRALTIAERRKVDPLVAQGLAPLAISKRLRLPYPPVRVYVRQMEATSPNGDRPKEPV